MPWKTETEKSERDVPPALWLLLGLQGAGEGRLYSNANCRIRNMAVVATRLQIAATATTRSIIKARRPLSVVLNLSAVHPSLLRPSQPPLPSSSLSSSLDALVIAVRAGSSSSSGKVTKSYIIIFWWKYSAAVASCSLECFCLVFFTFQVFKPYVAHATSKGHVNT